MPNLYLPFDSFVIVKDSDALMRRIANRHYSRIWKGNLNAKKILGPGTPMCIISPNGDWVFCWRRSIYRKDGQTGVECAIFRNESQLLSSKIILMCESLWDERHGPERKFTYVHPGKIRSSNPGYCFTQAGWTRTKHISTRGLRLLVKEL